MPEPRSRCWCFTLNNYTSADLTNLFEHEVYMDGPIEKRPALVTNDAGKPRSKCNYVNYLVVGLEVGQLCGTSHMQGYIEFENARSLKGVKKILGNQKIHLEIRKGTPEQASNYCKKGEQPSTEWEEMGINGPNFGKNANFREYGTRIEGKPGKRTDLIEIKDEIMKGKKVNDITLESPQLFHQYGRTFNKIEDLAMQQKFRTEHTEGFWYFGKTNLGKSHEAFKDFNPKTHYIYPYDGGWWDLYTQQETVIINDFRGEIPYNMLLQLLDKWPFYVRRRCREPIPFTSKKIIITSSAPPDEIYWRTNENDSIEQLIRRLTIIELKAEFQLPPDINNGTTGTKELEVIVKHNTYIPPTQQPRKLILNVVTSPTTYTPALPQKEPKS